LHFKLVVKKFELLCYRIKRSAHQVILEASLPLVFLIARCWADGPQTTSHLQVTASKTQMARQIAVGELQGFSEGKSTASSTTSTDMIPNGPGFQKSMMF
jgi:hypothetical protein